MTLTDSIHGLSHHHVIKHLLQHIEVVISLILACLLIGMCGYHYYENLSWVDAFLNASMILGGMGPATPLASTAGKVFAGVYALFSGLIFIAIIALMLSPVFHAIIQKAKLDELEEKPKK
jgi:hypothetical protein